MRFKVAIEEKVMIRQDSSGQPIYGWEPVCTAWASQVEDGWIIKHTNKVKPKMRAIGNSRIAIIGKVEVVEDGGNKFLKLIFDSIRGDFGARMRNVPKAAALPSTQNEAEKQTEIKILC